MPSLAPQPKFRFFTAGGLTTPVRPLVGGKVYFYAAGTNTPKDTFTDATGSTPNTNPVILNARGEADIWLGDGAYKMVVTDAAGVQQGGVIDNVRGIDQLVEQANDYTDQLAEDLADTTQNTTGMGKLGFSHARTYPQGTGGDALQLFLNVRNLPYVAKIDGSTDDLGPLNSALTTPRKAVYGPEGDLIVSSNPTNIYGARIGPVRVLKPISGGLQQLNTYADDGRIVVAPEYRYRIYERLRAVGNIKAFLYGDSTISDNNTTSSQLALAALLPKLAQVKGLQGALQVTNRGVSGTQIGAMNAIPDLAADTDLFIIKYGINDGANPIGTRLATFASALRSKLAAIRAAAFGSIDALTIVLMGPNSTSDTPNGRDERWYEQLRGIYVQAARDFNCFYFDTYALLKDARPAASLWMDNPFGDGRAIHPRDAMQCWIWGRLIDELFGDSETAPYRKNYLINAPAYSLAALALASPPGDYPYGVSMFRALLADGWPVDGAIITHRHADNIATQTLVPFSAGSSTTIRRVANVGGNAWNRWTGVNEALTLAGTWVNYDIVGWVPAQAGICQDGWVTVQGLIKSGNAASGQQLATLPTGMRPAQACLFPAPLSTGANGILRVEPTGGIFAQTAVDAGYTSLSSIRFKAA